MLFVVHALDKKDILQTRAKHYRHQRIHLDKSGDHGVDVVTAGTLLADDGETPVGSIFVIDAADRAAVDAFTKSDPYHLNGVGARVEINRYNKKRGTPIARRRSRCFILPRESGEGGPRRRRGGKSIGGEENLMRVGCLRAARPST